MVYKESEIKQTNIKKESSKTCSKETYLDDINRLDNNITTLERDYVLFKNDINNNLKNLTENVVLLTKNIDKLYDVEKRLIEQTHNDKTHEEKIANIEKKIEWITKLFISTILVIGIKFIYDIKGNTERTVYIQSDQQINNTQPNKQVK